MTKLVEPPATTSPGRCPIHHAHDSSFSERKSARPGERLTPALERVDDRLVIRSFGLARTILRDPDATQQWGFAADRLERSGSSIRDPILYQEGAEHKAQRTATARFFTPQTVSRDYREMMNALADDLVGEVKARGEAELSGLSMQLAVQVAAQVVGLTNSSVQGMSRRLERFFTGDPSSLSWRPDKVWRFLKTQMAMWSFYYRDVKPAIRARRAAPKEDVISHLLSKDYKDIEILTECVTYAAAGMITTREFIVMAAWHLLERDDLRAHYLQADEAERVRMLHEILRLEPVVGHLHRRTRKELRLEHAGEALMIPAKTHLDFDLRAINAEAETVGENPLTLCPERQLAKGVQGAVMSFGDGHHRCPGAYIAIQESDIFLRKLLALPLRVVKAPTLHWNDLVEGYELSRFVLAYDAQS